MSKEEKRYPRVVQIAAAEHQSTVILFVLLEDGTLHEWQLREWHQLPHPLANGVSKETK